MRAALYARYSTDEQSELSVDDQFRVCERHAQREGLQIAARFEDRAISGGTHERPAYQAMLEAVRRREVDVIVAEDLKRLWRELAEQWRAIKELLDLGIAIVTVSGIDSRQKNFEILASVIGAAAELDRKETGYRTRRGLEGRAIAGKSAGGRAYGYLSEAESPTGARVVEPARAAIVREIFDRFAAGEQLRAIASDLNVRGIPSPGANWKRQERARDGLWRVSAIHALLHNEIYIGRLIWNRSRWVRSAANSKNRRYVENPPEEWIVHDRQDLRIIDDDTWARAQRRLSERAELYKPGRGGRSKYLLSGLLRCASCGAAFTVAAHRPVRYACSTRRAAGDQACGNHLMVARELVERKIIGTVRDRFLSREARELAVSTLRKAAKEEGRAPHPEVSRLDQQIRELERLKREGILSGEIAGAALRQAYRDREVAHRTMRADVVDPVFGAEAAYTEAIEQLESVLEGDDAVESREALREVIESIQLHPRDGVLWAELKGRQLALVNWNGSGGSIWTRLAA